MALPRVALAADGVSQWKKPDLSQDDLAGPHTTGNGNEIGIGIESVIAIVSVNAEVVRTRREDVVAVAERNENGSETLNANVADAVILEEPPLERKDMSLGRPRDAEPARAKKTVAEIAEREKRIPNLDRAAMSMKAVSDLLLHWVEDHLHRHHHLPFQVTRRKIEDGVQAAVAATAAVSHGTGIETGIASGDGIGTTIATGEAGDLTENEADLEGTMDRVKEEVVVAEEACAWEGKANGPGEGNEWEEKWASFCCILHSFEHCVSFSSLSHLGLYIIAFVGRCLLLHYHQAYVGSKGYFFSFVALNTGIQFIALYY
jgi:hypothetical protein